MVVYVLFFCFKQNTAYEMRISDWSSDVCSSDLEAFPRKNKKGPADRRPMVPSHGPRAVHETQTSEHVLEHRVDGVAIGQQVALATAEVRRVADFRRQRLQVVAGDAAVEHLAVLDELQQIGRASCRESWWKHV